MIENSVADDIMSLHIRLQEKYRHLKEEYERLKEGGFDRAAREAYKAAREVYIAWKESVENSSQLNELVDELDPLIFPDSRFFNYNLKLLKDNVEFRESCRREFYNRHIRKYELLLQQ